jgi:hypothetical protein
LNGTYATTGSNTFAGIQTVNSNLIVTGSITAQTLVVQTITSSVDFVTGSTRFGSSLSTSTHQFTGSVSVTGSLAVVTNGTEFQVTSTGVNFGNALTDSHTVTGSLLVTGSISVGISNPTSLLNLYSASTASDVNYIKMEMPSWGGSANYKKNIIWHDSGNVVGGIGMSFTSPYTYMDFHSFYNSAHTTGSVMRIQGNGLVGIGTTAPSFRLSFGGDTATTIGMNQSILGTAPALTLKGADSTTGTNNEGGAVYISAGLGTGNGATSNIIFSTGATLGSGATRQTLTERMRITAAGNVGIGTSSPTVSQTGGGLALGDGTAQKGIRFNVESGGWGYIEYYEASTAKWITGFRSADGSYNIKTGTNLSTGNGISIANTGITTINNKLILGTSTFVGEIQYGTSGYGTHDYNAGNGKFTWLSAAGAVSGTVYYSFNADGFGARFTISNNGAASLVGTLTQNASDKRLKDNVKNIDNALNKVMALNGVTFNWNDIAVEYGWSPRIKNNDVGVIAQDVQAVLPQAIDFAPFDRDDNQQSKSGENYLTVQYEKIVPLLIEAIKELKAEIEELKNK